MAYDAVRSLTPFHEANTTMREFTLATGAKGAAELIVGPEHTAPHVGSGKIAVLATPVMVNLMEAAALAAVEAHLPQGYQTLGIRLDVSHIAATPVGMQVRAHAELTRADGRQLSFHVVAKDEVEVIGEGSHERVVVNVERFDRRVQEKAAKRGSPKAQGD
jgi:fluoroacetyl-CoA thioesterase